jgi:hypothetical protein
MRRVRVQRTFCRMKMMFSNWKVQLRRESGRIGYSAIIYSQNRGKYDVVKSIDSKGITVETIEDGASAPELYLEPEIVEALAIAFDELYKERRGEFVEGELAATKVHLRDLRFLLRLPPPESKQN